MRELKKQFCLRRDEMLLILGMELGAFIFGEILLGIVMFVQNEEEPVPVGMSMVLVVLGALFVMMGSTLALCFNYGISMCAVRRRFVPAFCAFSYLEFLLGAGIAYPLYHLERWIIRTFYARDNEVIRFGVIFDWRYILTAGIVVVALHTLIGTAFLRFGKITYIVLWAVWMIVCFGGSRIVHLQDKYKDLAPVKAAVSALRFLSGLGENSLMAAMAAVSLVLMAVSWLMLRRQQVTL